MSGTAYGNLNVHVNRCQSLPDVGSGLCKCPQIFLMELKVSVILSHTLNQPTNPRESGPSRKIGLRISQ